MKNTVRFMGILFVMLMFLAGCCPQYVFVPSDILFGNMSSEEDEAKETSYGWISTGSGTADSPYVLSTVGDIRGFAELFNSGAIPSNASISLTPGEYDFSGIEFPGIGTGSTDISGGEFVNATPFTGTFNGNGAVIRNLSIANRGENAGPAAFFNLVQDADINNLNFENAHIESDSSTTAVAVGFALDSSVTGITVSDSYISSPECTAAIISRFQILDTTGDKVFRIEGNSVKGTTIIAADSYNVAGIIGFYNGRRTEGTSKVSISDNTVDFTGPAYIRGVNLVSGLFGTLWLRSNDDVFENNKVIADGPEDFVLDTVTQDEVAANQFYNISGYIYGNVSQNQDLSPHDSLPMTGDTVILDGIEYKMTFLRDDPTSDYPVPDGSICNYIQDGTYNSAEHFSRNPVNDAGVPYGSYDDYLALQN